MVVHDGSYASTAELTDIHEEVDENGRVKVRAHAANLRVTISERGTAYAGSYPIYRHGTNAVPLSLTETQGVDDEIRRRLRLEDEGIVVRLDMGVNIPVEHAPAQYTRLALGAGRVDAYPAGPASIKIGRSPTQDVLYDKVAEARAKGLAIPPGWDALNVIRYETRCLRRVKAAFGRHIYTSDLWSPEFNAEAIRRAVARFLRIRFARARGPVPTHSLRALEAHLYAAGIEAIGGAAALLRLVNAVQKQTAAERTQASRVRARIRERATDPAAGIDLAAELRTAIHAAAALSLG